MAQRYLLPSPGVVTAIEGAERFADHPDLAYLEIRAKLGDRIGPVDSHPARAGVVITTGETREVAMALAEYVVERILIATDANMIR
ncbi:MAG: hypothetical protein VBE63_28390 [Lamprobacter sp.]|uniref:hypothetical protein n=1 Tax=Lamprobacter sp. TaxID=3100796 RepID=UPI002B25C4B1|nr:hypothetical protein [Lamprobacter sp.]MEA3643814.1 hypothetical protein [Lamprobacter sp.]